MNIDMKRFGIIDDDILTADISTVDPLQRAENILPLLQKGSGVYLHGDSGIGKSFLAAALLKFEIESVYVNEIYACWPEVPISHVVQNFRFVRINDLFREIRACFADKAQESDIDVIDRYSNYRVLVLDDIGVSKPTDFVVQVLDDIIDFRYRTRKSRKTIITGNLTLEELAIKYGQRIASRILGMCEVIELSGNDRRSQKGEVCQSKQHHLTNE